MPELITVISAIENDPLVKVVVFDSAVAGFFLTHYDFVAEMAETTSLAPSPTGMHPSPDMLVRLSRAPTVSIVSIRGRATGVGSELAGRTQERAARKRRAKSIGPWYSRSLRTDVARPLGSIGIDRR